MTSGRGAGLEVGIRGQPEGCFELCEIAPHVSPYCAVRGWATNIDECTEGGGRNKAEET